MISSLYLWTKIIHIFSFTAWFAGIFYIWRLYVYYVETSSDDVKKQLLIMAYRLYYFIMRWAALSTIITGSLLFYLNFKTFSIFFWIWIKIALVLFILAWHFLANYFRIQLEKGNKYSSKMFRLYNEIPTITLLLIIILVIIKPF